MRAQAVTATVHNPGGRDFNKAMHLAMVRARGAQGKWEERWIASLSSPSHQLTARIEPDVAMDTSWPSAKKKMRKAHYPEYAYSHGT